VTSAFVGQDHAATRLAKLQVVITQEIQVIFREIDVQLTFARVPFGNACLSNPRWMRREREGETCALGRAGLVLEVASRLNFYFSYSQLLGACSVKPAASRSRIFHPRRSPRRADCALLALLSSISRDGRDGRTKFPLRRWDSNRPVSRFLPRKSPHFFVLPYIDASRELHRLQS